MSSEKPTPRSVPYHWGSYVAVLCWPVGVLIGIVVLLEGTDRSSAQGRQVLQYAVLGLILNFGLLFALSGLRGAL